jgi:hypothetical protein
LGQATSAGGSRLAAAEPSVGAAWWYLMSAGYHPALRFRVLTVLLVLPDAFVLLCRPDATRLRRVRHTTFEKVPRCVKWFFFPYISTLSCPSPTLPFCLFESALSPCKADYALALNSNRFGQLDFKQFRLRSYPETRPVFATTHLTDIATFSAEPRHHRAASERAHLYIPGISRCWDLHDTLFGLLHC